MYYIYEIFNKVTDRKYIGMTTNYQKRFETHMTNLRYGKHAEKVFQRDYILYGRESFDYRLLEVVEDRVFAHEREKHYMKLFKTIWEDYGYNSQDSCFNKYQNSADSVNSQNFFYRKIKESGQSLQMVAEQIGMTRKSLLYGITHTGSMKAIDFMNLVNYLDLNKQEVIEYIGWIRNPLSKLPQEDRELLKNLSKLSEEELDLVLKVMDRLIASH